MVSCTGIGPGGGGDHGARPHLLSLSFFPPHSPFLFSVFGEKKLGRKEFGE